MGNKEKGANVERELLNLFVENNWRAVRVAGSGLNSESPCDLIAGKFGKRKFCIEVKSSKKPYRYISKKQLEDFLVFSNIIGLEPLLAVRFNREGWFFLKPENLEDSGKFWKINLESARKSGKRFGQIFD